MVDGISSVKSLAAVLHLYQDDPPHFVLSRVLLVLARDSKGLINCDDSPITLGATFRPQSTNTCGYYHSYQTHHTRHAMVNAYFQGKGCRLHDTPHHLPSRRTTLLMVVVGEDVHKDLIALDQQRTNRLHWNSAMRRRYYQHRYH
jgi:hypothetical protein